MSNTKLIKVLTSGCHVLFYTGRVGNDWLTENACEAREYSDRAAKQQVESLQEEYRLLGLNFSVVDKPGDLHFELVDNGGDELASRGIRGGLSPERQQMIADQMAASARVGHGQARVRVRDSGSWIVLHTLELTV